MNKYYKVGVSQYDIINKNPLPWFGQADQLAQTGIMLRELSVNAHLEIKEKLKNDSPQISIELTHKSNCYKEAALLYGYAIENVLKGLWILKFGTKDKNLVRKLKSSLNNHKLIELSNEVDLVINPSEEKFLKYFTEAILWFGKYPIPLNSDQYFTFFKEGKAHLFISNMKKELPKSLQTLWEKLVIRKNELIIKK